MPANSIRNFPEARAVLDELLRNLDATAPGLVTGVHLIGSIALGDARPGRSDIDLVLVRDDAAGNVKTMTALEPSLRQVRETHPAPVLDGIILSAGDLAVGPDRIDGERPIIFDNELRLGVDGSTRNPVTWQSLAQCGITYRGTPIHRDTLWHDPSRLATWTRENLIGYWRPWLDRAGAAPLERLSAVELESIVEWGVLGVVRLHYTLATGAIVSKGGAAEYALVTFDKRWHPIVSGARRIRERDFSRSLYGDLRARHADMCAFIDMVIADALELSGPDRS